MRNPRGNLHSEAYQQPVSDDEFQIAIRVFTRVVYVPHHPRQSRRHPNQNNQSDELKEMLTLAVILGPILHFPKGPFIIENVFVSKILKQFEFPAKFLAFCV